MSDTRSAYHDVAGVYGPIALAVLLLVFLLVVGIAVRYRASARRTRSQRAGAPGVEGLFVLALAAIAAGLVGFTFHTENREDRLAPHPALTINVTAAKWTWRFGYPGGVTQGGGSGTPTLVVPAGVPVRFALTSYDVVHAFWIPDLRFKRDANPRAVTRFDLRFPGRGGYSGVGECSEFCGLDHADMRFLVRALSPARFRAWLGRRQAAR